MNSSAAASSGSASTLVGSSADVAAFVAGCKKDVVVAAKSAQALPEEAMRVSLLADPAETDYQRLQAQNVQSKKAHKVLVDVLRALFAEIFIEEVFRPQETYSAASTRQIFERLAQ